MSYSVNFYGHKDFDTPEETEAFEKDVIEKVTAFAQSLPGLSGGTINTSGQPQAILQPSDGAEPTNPDGSPIVAPDVTLAETPPENPTAPPAVQVLPDSPAPSGGGSPASLADLSTEEIEAELVVRAASSGELQAELARRSAGK